jgi:DNA-directed RNA polymerase subunit RPC12/RpoP
MTVTFNGKPINLPPTDPISVYPCIRCGSENIKLWDCGYSSFNPGGGKCVECGREVQDMVSCMPTPQELANIWNGSNDKTKRISRIESEIVLLKKELIELRKRK